MEQKRISDFGIKIGKMKKGKLNKITDVKGVRVGHSTIKTESHNTGVTVIMPTDDNVFLNKLVAASYVSNGFGKTMGLVQVDELGTLETPIALTNTLNVGIARSGSYTGHDSGEIFIGFSTANRLPHDGGNDILNLSCVNEKNMDTLFRAAGEATEKAILNSMVCAEKWRGMTERLCIAFGITSIKLYNNHFYVSDKLVI